MSDDSSHDPSVGDTVDRPVRHKSRGGAKYVKIKKARVLKFLEKAIVPDRFDTSKEFEEFLQISIDLNDHEEELQADHYKLQGKWLKQRNELMNLNGRLTEFCTPSAQHIQSMLESNDPNMCRLLIESLEDRKVALRKSLVNHDVFIETMKERIKYAEREKGLATVVAIKEKLSSKIASHVAK